MTTDQRPLLETGLAALGFARASAFRFSEDITDETRTKAPFEGGNHVAWVWGHLAWTDDYFMKEFSGGDSRIPESWQGLFGMGSEPRDDPGAYPALEELKRVAEERRAEVRAWFESKSEAELLEDLPEQWQSFAKTYAVLMSTLAAHECMHVGQILTCRKALKMGYAWTE
ncbi:MAG: DinB family protein [Phycisphaerales bacterium]|nr:DinB family protein [Phycisphaerales bacterium]